MADEEPAVDDSTCAEIPAKVEQSAGLEIETTKKPSKKRLIITSVIGIVIMVGLFYVLLPQMGDYGSALEQLRKMSIWGIAGLIVASAINLALYPLTVLVSVPGLRYWPGFIQRQVGFLISCSIPGGGVFAVGAEYKILAYYRVPPAASAAAVSADAVWTYLLTLAMPATAVMLLVFTDDQTTGLIAVAVVGAIAVVISVIAIMVTLRSEAGARKTGAYAESIIAPIMRRLKKPVPELQEALILFRTQAHDLVATRWGRITVTNVIAQTTPILVLLVALIDLDEFPQNLNIIEVFAAYSVAILLVSIPITPGGLGTVDAALVALLTSFGCSGSSAVAADLVWRLVWFLPQIVAGLAAGGAYLLAQRRTPHAVENIGDLHAD